MRSSISAGLLVGLLLILVVTVAGETTSVVLLIHGILTYSSALTNFAESLNTRLQQQQQSGNIVILNAQCNHLLTTDGIAAGGTRLYHYLMNRTNSYDFGGSSNSSTTTDKPVNLIVIGHSLGGMYGRYMLSLFKSSARQRFNLQLFMTLATPHLGSTHHTLDYGIRYSLPHWIGPSVYWRTLRDLMLDDLPSNPLLLRMATSPQFIDTLSQFKQLILYSNIKRDLSVSYSTAAIYRTNPFYDDDGDLIPQLAHRKTPCIINETELFDITKKSLLPHHHHRHHHHHHPFTRPTPPLALKERQIEQMVRSLETLPWVRFSILPKRWFHAHVDIVCKELRPECSLILDHIFNQVTKSVY